MARIHINSLHKIQLEYPPTPGYLNFSKDFHDAKTPKTFCTECKRKEKNKNNEDTENAHISLVINAYNDRPFGINTG
jgi:hypothetical protein